MRANREYRLLHRPAGRMPARFADPGRIDTVEIVEVASGEVVLFWDVHAREVPGMLKALRRDLTQLEAAEFFARWRQITAWPPTGAF
jgi:hypothetical protein